jgi:hypothetical protein
MPKNSERSRNNRKSDWGVMEMARERPVAAAAAAAGAAAAGLFLWSKRAQISDQLNTLSDQIGEWKSGNGEFGGEFDEQFDDTAGLTTTGKKSSARSTAGRGRKGMSTTGGGNAGFGAHSGGGGMTSSASGRGRAKQPVTS